MKMKNFSVFLYKVINLSLLDKIYGQADFNKMTKRIVHMVKSGDLEIDSIDEDLIGSNLKGNEGLPDPETGTRREGYGAWAGPRTKI